MIARLDLLEAELETLERALVAYVLAVKENQVERTRATGVLSAVREGLQLMRVQS